MISFQVSIEINRPLEEVFAYLSNLENNSEWRSSSFEARKTSEGPIGVGTRYRMVNNILGLRLENEAEVIEYEPNRKCTNRSTSGPLPITAQRIFERVKGGTRVRFVVEVEPRGFFKLVEPFLARLARRRVVTDAAHLKNLMEARAL